ncbi:DUF4244 domain-containing protein [Aeromicrobium sp. Marseille-Q0843]|uniref:DUF4244 domain-containing protein n=1 Tax=Aeromicrobium phoceense TaxID=2754045 RepID=A0A838X9Q2_9ACTN|nr:DUF4244 domain-containing protein [Aeromicrobium phoceense]MBA4607295.1 DUF4244 domain-containing protein [Aeromicrobium phoceense]
MKLITALRRHVDRADERGMSTSEYAVGTLGACTIGGVLVKVGQSEWFGELVQDLISRIPDLLPF